MSESEPCPCCGYEEPRVPWHVKEERADEVLPESFTPKKTVYHRYKSIYHSTAYHKEWAFLPSDLLVQTWQANARLPVERLSLFLQAVMGPSDLLYPAGTEFLRSLVYSHDQGNIEVAAMAVGLSHVLASNGGYGCTLTVARPATGYPDASHQPVYVRFEKDVTDIDLRVPRFPDDRDNRVGERDYTMDSTLLRAARRIQDAASHQPVEVALSLESYRGPGGDLGVGLSIQHDTTLDDQYRDQRGQTDA